MWGRVSGVSILGEGGIYWYSLFELDALLAAIALDDCDIGQYAAKLLLSDENDKVLRGCVWSVLSTLGEEAT